MSTLLTTAITFKSLIKQLSKREFLKFMGKMYDMNHSDLISTTLFNHFINPPSRASFNTDNLNNINSIISTIIQSRKPKPKQLPSTNIKLDEFPKALIGHISSFLAQNEYFQFEKTNRSIFIGCNSPNMLMELNLFNVADYSSINLSQFKSLKKLQINLSKFHQFPLAQNGQFILNQLDDLSLCGQKMKDFDIEPFMNQNCINIKNIQSVHFIHFGTLSDRFNKDKFWRLLTHFKNIEFLGLYAIILTKPTFAKEKLKKLYDLYPQLKGLCVCEGNRSINNDLINIFGNNLQILKLDYPPRPRFDFSNIDFGKLQHVILVTPSVRTINEILKSGQNITQFSVDPHAEYNITSPSPQELKTIIPQIFKCKSLQFFEIGLNDETYLSVLDGIEIGIYGTREYERKQMKIRMNGCKNTQIDLKKIIFNIGRIIRWLESSKINNFMVICDMNNMDKEYANKLDTSEILDECLRISANVEAFANELCFVITNKYCKISGWDESSFQWGKIFLRL